MANEDKKDFNAMLHESKGMPRIQLITDPASIRKYGGSRMLLAPPLAYDRAMRAVPCGRLLTVGDIRAWLARKNGADFTDPITAGIFVSIAAWASWQIRSITCSTENAVESICSASSAGRRGAAAREESASSRRMMSASTSS